MSGQLGFAEAFLAAKAGQNRRLERILEVLDWWPFEVMLRPLATRGGPGRPSYPALAMFKAMLLAQWYQLSDPALEEALADRISFRRFCGFALDAVTPDETTLCRFRHALAAAGLGEALMAELDRQLGCRGFLVKEGTMIDATLIKQRGRKTIMSTMHPSRRVAKRGSILTQPSPRRMVRPSTATRLTWPSTAALA